MNITKQIEIIDLVLNAIKENNANEFFRVRDSLFFAFFENGYKLKDNFIDLFPANYIATVARTLNVIQKSAGFSCDLIDGAGGSMKLNDAIFNLEYIKKILCEESNKQLSVNKPSDNTAINPGDIKSTIEDNLPLLVRDLILVCRKMQKNFVFFKNGTFENVRNTQVRDCMELIDYSVDDQTLQGVSSSGKNSGEIDLLISEKGSKNEIVVEGLNLTCCDTSLIEEHFNKIFGYDTFGNLYNVELVYCNVKDLNDLKDKYVEVLRNFKNTDYPTDNIIEISSNSSRLFILQSHQLINGKDNFIYHLLIQFLGYKNE